MDPLFTSAAAHYGRRVVGTLLSGGGWDGVSGLLSIKAAGGLSIAQDPTEAPYDSMPMHAILDDHVDSVLRATEILAAIPLLVEGRTPVELPRVGSARARFARSQRPAS